MRAAVVERYGPPDVVRVVDCRAPMPGKGELRVRVRAAAVTSADARIRGARYPRGFALPARLVFGWRRPRWPVLGSAYSGVVDALGPGVQGFAAGDAVCGMAGLRLGAHAEYLTVRAERVARRPGPVCDDDAAGVLFGGLTALHFLRDRASVGAGRSVLVIGASGAVGTSAVQLARHAAAEVTAVTSTRNLGRVAALGAQRVIDYTRDDFAALGARYDIVFDTVGVLSIATGRRLLTGSGKLLLAAADLMDTLRARGNVVAGPSPERLQDVELLLRLVADGTLKVVHDRHYALDDIVAAHRHVDSGRKVGNVIVHP
jgi:NADPH:quinone reductase-like Zn-dependent oxidoreductase